MKLVYLDYKNIKPRKEPLTMCLGYFDGIHLGHQFLIETAKKLGKYKLSLLTFDRPISTLINNGKSKQILTTIDDRYKLLDKFGVENFFVVKITKSFLNLSDVEFIQFLKKLHVNEIFIGTDYRFGKNGGGNIEILSQNFKVHFVDTIEVGNEKVSSQRIISLLQEAKLEEVYKLLGRNYSVTGKVVPGKRIGRKIGFPTLNLDQSIEYVLPKFGVYRTLCYIDGVPHVSITNVGKKPTITKNNVANIETHLLDVENIKNVEEMSIEFLEFLRPEMKFNSLEELKLQIEKDIISASK